MLLFSPYPSPLLLIISNSQSFVLVEILEFRKLFLLKWFLSCFSLKKHYENITVLSAPFAPQDHPDRQKIRHQ